MSLNKFTHIPLLKNDAKLKKKKKKETNNHTKKSNHPKFFIKIKNMFQKKSHPIKIKINYHAQALKNQKKKKKWQLATWLPKKKNKAKKTGNVTGCLGEKKNQGREKKEKKCNLNWGYLCKVHLSALFPLHFPPKLGG